MARQENAAQPDAPEDVEAARLRAALKEREQNLKDQIAKAESLPDTESDKDELIKNFKRQLETIQKELRK